MQINTKKVMGNEIIEVVYHDVYLGVVHVLANKLDFEYEEIEKNVPNLCYILEIINTDDKSIACLETFHFGMAKLQQGIPIHCSNPSRFGTIGWKSIKPY